MRVSGVGPEGVAGEQEMDIKVEMLGRTVDLKVPTEVTIDGEAAARPPASSCSTMRISA